MIEKEGDIEDVCKLFKEDEINHIRSHLLGWYDVNMRKLPWREQAAQVSKQRRQQEDIDEETLNRLGYVVWVSEIMLQQTRVDTVIKYWNKWVKRWPTVQDLAAAELNV